MKVIIVGCTHAGIAAAQQILERDPSTQVTIYERTDNVSFLSCGIALYIDGETKHLKDLFYSSPKQLEDLGAKVRIKHEVIEIDAKKKTVLVENLEKSQLILDHYDKLIYTAGSLPYIPKINGLDHNKVYLCKDAEDAQRIKDAAEDNYHIAIVGGGYVGTELAESLMRTGHQVSIISSGKTMLHHYLDEPLANKVREILDSHGAYLYLNERAIEFSGSDEVYVRTNRAVHDVDAVVVCVGFTPNTSLLRGQVKMDSIGAIEVNRYQQSSDPDIYAAGDSTAAFYNPLQRNAYIPLATNAIRQATVAGMNVLGNQIEYAGNQGSTGLRLFEYTEVSTGLTYEYALKNNLNVRQVTLTNKDNVFLRRQPIYMSLVYDYQNHQILGCQLLSAVDVSQSINAMSLAIAQKTTIEELSQIDLAILKDTVCFYSYLNLLGQAAIDQEAQLADA